MPPPSTLEYSYILLRSHWLTWLLSLHPIPVVVFFVMVMTERDREGISEEKNGEKKEGR